MSADDTAVPTLRWEEICELQDRWGLDCEQVSAEAIRIIAERTGRVGHRMFGWVADGDADYPHCWIELDGFILDFTAEQFYGWDRESGVVQPGTPEHAIYRDGKRRFDLEVDGMPL